MHLASSASEMWVDLESAVASMAAVGMLSVRAVWMMH